MNNGFNTTLLTGIDDKRLNRRGICDIDSMVLDLMAILDESLRRRFQSSLREVREDQPTSGSKAFRNSDTETSYPNDDKG